MGRKTNLLIFQATIKQHLTLENVVIAKKGKSLKRETEPFLIAPQNNAIKTNYIKARIDKMLQNVVIETKRSITYNK